MTLPPGWELGLDLARRLAVLTCERRADSGFFRIQPARHKKGYYRVSLPGRHPYASSGTQLLHRYVFMRHLGRRLERFEHVHHRPGAPLDTVDVRDLDLLEELHHGLYHYGERICCGEHHPLWSPRNSLGWFARLPSEDEIAEARSEM